MDDLYASHAGTADHGAAVFGESSYMSMEEPLASSMPTRGPSAKAGAAKATGGTRGPLKPRSAWEANASGAAAAAPSGGGAKISEEKFLALQAENRRLKGEAVEKDDRLKQLAARLARSDEAGRKLTVQLKELQQRLGAAPGGAAVGRQTAASAASARLFTAEQRCDELEAHGRDLQRRLEAEQARVLQHRAAAKDAKARLEELLRASRTVTRASGAKVTGGAAHAGGGHDDGSGRSTVEAARQVMELQKEVDVLRRENVRLLKGAVAAARAGGVGQSQAQAGMDGQWALEETAVDGRTYLLDRASGMLYAPGGDWPHLVGRLAGGGRLELAGGNRDLFAALDEYLKSQQVRLRDVFDSFDHNHNGRLEPSEVDALLRALMPGVTPPQQRYFAAMLGARNGQGDITYAELVAAITSGLASGVSAAAAATPPELKRLRDLAAPHAGAVGAALRSAAARVSPPVLDYGAIGALLKSALGASVTGPMVQALLADLHASDLDGTGTATPGDVERALRLVAPVVARHGSSPAPAATPYVIPYGGTPGAGAGGQYGAGAALGAISAAEATELRRENARLKRDAEDARAAASALDDRAMAAPGRGHYGPVRGSADLEHLLSSPPEAMAAELKSAWEQLGLLQRRYADGQAALGAIRANHGKVLAQLEETGARLREERKACLRLEHEERRLAMEADAAKMLEPLLEEARAERLRLQEHNLQLERAALAAPGAALRELTALRLELADAKRQLAAGDLREMEARHAASRDGRGKPEPGSFAALAREDDRAAAAERDAAVSRARRLQSDLDSAREKLAVLEAIAADRGLTGGHQGGGKYQDTSAPPPYVAASAVDASSTREQLLSALNDLRGHFADREAAAARARQLQAEQAAQCEDLQLQLVDAEERAALEIRSLEQRVAANGRELARRADEIRLLRAQVAAAGGRPVGPGGAGTRLLSGGGSARASGAFASARDREEEPGLRDGENLFELTLESADLSSREFGGDLDPSTFLTVDFFEHETQATAVATGVAPRYDLGLQYVVVADAFFIEYLDSHLLRVELHRAGAGGDFATLGAAVVPLKSVLRDVESGAAYGPHRAVHAADLLGPGGRTLGVLRYTMGLRRAIGPAVKDYRRLAAAAATAARGGVETQPPRALPAAQTEQVVGAPGGMGGADGLESYAAAAAAAAAAPHAAASVRVTIFGCSGLRPRPGRKLGPGEPPLVPYVSYQMPGYPDHDTVFGAGTDPRFRDTRDFGYLRSAALERRMSRGFLELRVFDDGDLDPTATGGVIGIASLPLGALADGRAVEGTWPLLSLLTNEPVGIIQAALEWRHTMDIPHNAFAAYAAPTPVATPQPPAPPRGAGLEADLTYGGRRGAATAAVAAPGAPLPGPTPNATALSQGGQLLHPGPVEGTAVVTPGTLVAAAAAKPRYSPSPDASIDGLPHGATAGGGGMYEDLDRNIVVAIEEVKLTAAAAAAAAASGALAAFVSYEFPAGAPFDDGQHTPAVALPTSAALAAGQHASGVTLALSHVRRFAVPPGGPARFQLATAMRAPDGLAVSFTLLGQRGGATAATGDEFVELGGCTRDLRGVLAGGGDWAHVTLPLLAKGVPPQSQIGTMTVTVRAARVLAAIMAEPAVPVTAAAAVAAAKVEAAAAAGAAAHGPPTRAA